MHDETELVDAKRLYFPALAGIYNFGAQLSYAFIRVLVALVFLPSGIDKMFQGGHARIAEGNIAALGLAPKFAWAWAVAGLEFFGAILFGLGLLTRAVSFAFVVQLFVITFMIQISNGYFWSSRGFEVGLLLWLIFIAYCFGGGGRYSLDQIGRAHV